MGITTTTDWASYGDAAPAVTTEAASVTAEPTKPETAGAASITAVSAAPTAPQPT